MIPKLITAPGEEYLLAHRATKAANDRTKCGQLVTADWVGLPIGLMTPICPGCDPGEAPQSHVRAPVPSPVPRVGSSGHPTTPQPAPTPQTPAEPLARTAERIPRGSHHNVMWRILAALTNPKG